MLFNNSSMLLQVVSSISANITSLKSVSMFPSNTSSVYCRIIPDRRNKLDTTLGVTNVKQIFISVSVVGVGVDVDVDLSPCGVNSTLPIFFKPEVLSHSIIFGRTIRVSLAVQLNLRPLILTVHLLCRNGITVLPLLVVVDSSSSPLTRPMYDTE